MSVSPPGAPNALAEAVRDELVAAGLPVLPWQPWDDFPPGTGVVIHAHADDPGAWIGWKESSALHYAVLAAMEAGAWSPDGSEMHPAIRHASTVTDAMLAAIAQILTSVGFRVVLDADDLQPDLMLVRERQPGPSWRDPAGPPLPGRAYMPGVRVRLIEGEYAGSETVVRTFWQVNTAEGPSYVYQVEHPHGTGELEVPATALTWAQND
ncbi:hypothetical protein [Micromonospora sp. IBSANI012]|uniref:hypothetical protein n=1 Tax=Micromonospora sp. IBSANI012 TaxID=3457761 RepID=UPI004059853A